jgi:hypothetical protein
LFVYQISESVYFKDLIEVIWLIQSHGK